jgi:hypothetical protein
MLPPPSFAISSAAGNNDDNGNDNIGGRGGGGDDGGDGGDGGSSGGNHGEALIVPAQVRRELDSLLADAKAAAEGGHVAGELLRRLADMERSPLLRWLLQFQGFRERLLADDLFLAKLVMECGFGVFTKVSRWVNWRTLPIFLIMSILIF